MIELKQKEKAMEDTCKILGNSEHECVSATEGLCNLVSSDTWQRPIATLWSNCDCTFIKRGNEASKIIGMPAITDFLANPWITMPFFGPLASRALESCCRKILDCRIIIERQEAKCEKIEDMAYECIDNGRLITVTTVTTEQEMMIWNEPIGRAPVITRDLARLLNAEVLNGCLVGQPDILVCVGTISDKVIQHTKWYDGYGKITKACQELALSGLAIGQSMPRMSRWTDSYEEHKWEIRADMRAYGIETELPSA